MKYTLVIILALAVVASAVTAPHHDDEDSLVTGGDDSHDNVFLMASSGDDADSMSSDDGDSLTTDAEASTAAPAQVAAPAVAGGAAPAAPAAAAPAAETPTDQATAATPAPLDAAEQTTCHKMLTACMDIQCKGATPAKTPQQCCETIASQPAASCTSFFAKRPTFCTDAVAGTAKCDVSEADKVKEALAKKESAPGNAAAIGKASAQAAVDKKVDANQPIGMLACCTGNAKQPPASCNQLQAVYPTCAALLKAKAAACDNTALNPRSKMACNKMKDTCKQRVCASEPAAAAAPATPATPATPPVAGAAPAAPATPVAPAAPAVPAQKSF